jgi:uncharacterized protein
MPWFDYDGARKYALERLQAELSPALIYHCVEHSSTEVLQAAQALAVAEGVGAEDLALLSTAVLYHDLGFVKRYQNNEEIAVQIACERLPEFGYRSAQVQTICGMILATRLPQQPQSLLEQIISDADLDVLGREDFCTRNQELRAEMAGFGIRYSDEDWFSSQLKFLQAHTYFTRSARLRRDQGKRRNIAALQTALAELSSAGSSGSNLTETRQNR